MQKMAPKKDGVKSDSFSYLSLAKLNYWGKIGNKDLLFPKYKQLSDLKIP